MLLYDTNVRVDVRLTWLLARAIVLVIHLHDDSPGDGGLVHR